MKRTIAFAILLALILPLASCSSGGENRPMSSVSPPALTEDTSQEQPVPQPDPPMPTPNPPMPLPVYPVIDGSTSTQLMHAAIRAHLVDEHIIDSHSQTYAALERLVPGNEDPADVLLAVEYHYETLEDAKNRGADLVITRIAKEGFVFIVNADNPVDSLTQQQL